MKKVVSVFTGGVALTPLRFDDDFADRLCYRYTSSLLIIFAVVVSTAQYVGQPIKCWVPAHFTENHEAYTNNYCWVKNTYYLPFEDEIPKEDEADKRHMIPYYQWMPIILLVQAILFYMPTTVWRAFSKRSGISISAIVESGATFRSTDKLGSKDSTMGIMVTRMDRFLESRESYRKGFVPDVKQMLTRTICRCCGRREGNFLIILYIIVKLLFIVSILFQFFVMDYLLGYKFSLYGINVLQALVQGREWQDTEPFPRVTMCDLKVRRLGNVQRYTVQCVLPINLFSEKIFLFLWVWMVILLSILIATLIQWSLRGIFRVDRHRYIKKHLLNGDVTRAQYAEMKEADQNVQIRNMAMFVDKYLRADGVFVLRLLGHNTNSVTVTEFVHALYANFVNKPEIEKMEIRSSYEH